jgi:PAS domain S-box-containing protein
VTLQPPSDFLETAPLVPFELDAESRRVLYVGPQASPLLGFEPEAWLEPGFLRSRILPDDQSQVEDARTAAIRSGLGRFDYRMEHADGRVIWVNECTRRVSGPSGTERLRGFLMDITNRKLQELTVWKSEQRLRALLRHAPDAMVLTDGSGRILDMNDQAEALFGYRLSDVVGSSIDHLMPARLQPRLPELREAFDRDPHRKSLVDGHTFAIERSDGVEIPVELSMSLVAGEDQGRQLLCSVRDLTARRRVEAQLRSSERQLREMANVVPAMVCFLDTDNRYRFVNDAYATWHGWEQRQMEGRLLREVIGEQTYSELEESIAAALAGQPTHFRGQMDDAEGRTVPVEVSLVPRYDEQGDTAGYLVVIFDVTDEVAARDADRRHRAELAHVSRVATLGELTASIAHELNQPLSAIVANARAGRRMLDQLVPDLGELGEVLDDIASSGRRAGDVIAGMRALLRKSDAEEGRKERVDPVVMIGDVIDLLRSEAIGRGVSVSPPTLAPSSAHVQGDAIQLKQVLLNLLMNAIEAASRAPAGSGAVSTEVRMLGSAVEIVVRDSGPGLPTTDPNELFQPFVSRRPGGLGMGLAISRSIVEAHDGQITGETDPGGGARFTVRLPPA